MRLWINFKIEKLPADSRQHAAKALARTEQKIPLHCARQVDPKPELQVLMCHDAALVLDLHAVVVPCKERGARNFEQQPVRMFFWGAPGGAGAPKREELARAS